MSRSIPQSLARIRLELTRGVVTCALAALPISHPAGVLQAQRRSTVAASARTDLRYAIHFEGVGAEGVDDIWRGRIEGPASGEIMLLVEYRGRPVDAAGPVWPVRVMAFVTADNPAQSFLAQMSGTIDWRSGDVQLRGQVSDGWMKGATVEQAFRLDGREFDGKGTLKLEPMPGTQLAGRPAKP